jgi:2-dehydro-3-deoxygluconokinase
MTGAPDVAVIGEILIEISADQPFRGGQLVRFGISGDALNAAAAAAASGAHAALVTRVGDDDLGKAIVARAAELGVDTTWVRPVSGQQGVYFSVADPSGARQFSYARRGSAACTMTPADLADVPAPRVVLASGITGAISASAADTVRSAASLSSTFIYDPNFRPRLTSAEAAAALLAELAPRAAVVTPSAPGETLALLGEKESAKAAAALRGLGASAVAVTCGADGVLLDTDGGQRLVPAVPAPLVVDQTGAGDVFAGTLAGRIALGDMLDDAVQLAVAAASLSIGGQGGTGLIPDIARTRAHLAANTAPGTPSAV